MKDTIDLTVGRDFRDSGPENTSLFRGDPILRRAGIRTFSVLDPEFPPRDKCEFCGRTIPPWGEENGLCKKCNQDIETPDEDPYFPWGREEMKGDTRILSL